MDGQDASPDVLKEVKRLFKEGGESQEEVREYSLDYYQFCSINNYMDSLTEAEGLAARFADNSYYISQQAFGSAILANLFIDDLVLQVIGDSQALGEMKSSLEAELSELPGDSGRITTDRTQKARYGIDNMGFH